MNIKDMDEFDSLRHGAQCNEVSLDGLSEVLLEITGEIGGADWHWICRGDSVYAYIHGVCNYTDWYFGSKMERFDATSMSACLLLVPQDERRIFEEMLVKGETVRSAQP